MKLTIFSGPSGSGKDYLAKKHQLLAGGTILKLNQRFKTQFEIDHQLPAGICNDKAYRGMTLACGPYQGQTLQDAMVQAYNESLSPEVPSYGAQFGKASLLDYLETLPLDDYVITDIRKRSEAITLGYWATRHSYEVTCYFIIGPRGQYQSSDRHLAEALNLLGNIQLVYNP